MNVLSRSVGVITVVTVGSVVAASLVAGVASGAVIRTFGGNEMSAGHVGGTSTLLADGRVLVVGGEYVCSVCEDVPTYTGPEVYSPQSGNWTRAASPAVARSGHGAALLPSGRVLITGGTAGAGGLASTEQYNPATNAWTPAAPMGTPRAGHEVLALPDGRVFVIGGNTGNPTAEIYTPSTNSWKPTSALPTTQDFAHAVLLKDGRVFATFSGQAAIYTPTTGTWRAVAQPPPGWSQLTVLNDGRVLMVSDRADVFDPVTEQWSNLLPGGLFEDNGFQAMALQTLPNGTVLVMGGGGGLGDKDGRVFLYDPSANSWSYVARNTLLGFDSLVLTGGDVMMLNGYWYGGDHDQNTQMQPQIFAYGRPGAPASVTVGAGARQLEVAWSPPTDTGKSPITGYRVELTPAAGGDSRTVSTVASARRATFTSLTNAASYTLTVTAINSSGSGIPKSASGVPANPPTCTISGTTANNQLVGTPGPDVICGRGGNDVIQGRGGGDTIVGGSGVDTVSFTDATSAVTVDLTSGQSVRQGTASSIREVENVDGSNFADQIKGTNSTNSLAGKNGNDTITNPWPCAPWDDQVGELVPSPQDTIYGGDGNDTVNACPQDYVGGGLGTDTISLGDPSYSLWVDLTVGRMLDETFTSGTIVQVENVNGWAGSNYINGSSAANRIVGGGYRDTLRGAGGNDTILGLGGDDVLFGDAGNDALFGGAATDTCTGGAGTDSAAECETTVGVP